MINSVYKASRLSYSTSLKLVTVIDLILKFSRYELTNDDVKLENVVMQIPCPAGSGAALRNIECGEANFVGGVLQWYGLGERI